MTTGNKIISIVVAIGAAALIAVVSIFSHTGHMGADQAIDYPVLIKHDTEAYIVTKVTPINQLAQNKVRVTRMQDAVEFSILTPMSISVEVDRTVKVGSVSICWSNTRCEDRMSIMAN